ncbi:hypothetical protein F1559_002916 [Cyanidiococcus yangmingshanensis]|uniref:Uncharacterized protein n=1 Tax=Cyanidiococcus yangmingshanensis TaxID=2690220 RepID=A0A7J7II12_9RHOD|nr:hypothetical protein F1559_002916 [Cyanidiococcus yangmingshanensis]
MRRSRNDVACRRDLFRASADNCPRRLSFISTAAFIGRSPRTRCEQRRAFTLRLVAGPPQPQPAQHRPSRALLWSAGPEARCTRESLAERLRAAYADTDSLPPCLPQTVEFAIVQAQYATLAVLQETSGSGVWSIELPMGRTKTQWYHSVPANEMRRYTRDLFHDYVELFIQHRNARVCVVVAPLDTTARQFGDAKGGWQHWRQPQTNRGPDLDAFLAPDASAGTTPPPGLLTYFEDVDPNEELSRSLMRSVFDSARNVLYEGHPADDMASLDYIGIAEAAADPETNVLGLAPLTSPMQPPLTLPGSAPWVLVPRDRRSRLQVLFAVRNSFIEQAGGIQREQLFDGQYGDDASAALPDVVVITNAVASRHLASVLRIVEACTRVGVPVLLFNCFLELASLTDLVRSPVKPHEQEALEASLFVQLARQHLGGTRPPLSDLLRQVRDGSMMGAEACYVCRALPRLGAIWRMRGARHVGLGAFPGSAEQMRSQSTAAGRDLIDPEPWHLFAETDWLEYEYATSLPYSLYTSLSAAQIEHILANECSYQRHQKEKTFGTTPSADTQALWCKQQPAHHAGFWPFMVPAMDFDLWAPPLDAAVDSWMWR